ncbi:glycerol-3-phosphate 1-O-acyltransferase PlsY [Desulfohalobiaceae bacterium Ax17]|uniref:glycerol-3-phosphate 1-O-acyltransferase PlsY n=1 Tax=Desulfovulcanus ferrireducens TaxID=2831190 RepID=UPI00207BCCFA|nr:glycerol-3-phosphate 1-O-acyltransferase PlsY [Desulfovulcanus ferrireducens]MBT8764274.1 glycerol-3-phosphate 1-O-acyltransferase PlsY [Desulfovulcanus ferrireducens]
MVSIFWLALTYLIGAMPFGLLIAQVFCRVDPRKLGSKNTGATNVARTCGLKYGVLTLALDILKGYLPVITATSFSNSTFFLSLTALAAVLGHMYSVFLYGKGGKGVATTIGVFAALVPQALLLSLLVCLAVIFLTGYVSLGSIALVSFLPLVLIVTGQFKLLPLSLTVMVFIFWKHRENIERLVKGEENRIKG